MKDLEINIANINYQKWKETINRFLLYDYFKSQVQKDNLVIKEKMDALEVKKDKMTKEEVEEYQKLIEELFTNGASISGKVDQNENNYELLNKIYQEKNIDVSVNSYERWIKTGEKIKI